MISTTYWNRRRNNSTDLLSLLIANTVSGTACMFRRELLDHAEAFARTLVGLGVGPGDRVTAQLPTWWCRTPWTWPT